MSLHYLLVYSGGVDLGVKSLHDHERTDLSYRTESSAQEAMLIDSSLNIFDKHEFLTLVPEDGVLQRP